jgi:hypothetical protein
MQTAKHVSPSFVEFSRAQTVDFKVLQKANEMNTWSVCPAAFRNLVELGFVEVTADTKITLWCCISRISRIARAKTYSLV